MIKKNDIFIYTSSLSVNHIYILNIMRADNKHQETNLACTELPGYLREIWENLAMRGHLQSVQKGTMHLELYYVNFG